MKCLACAVTAAAILAAPTIANARGAAINPGVNRSHAAKPHRVHSAANHVRHPAVRSYGYAPTSPNEAYSLEYEDRDRGFYMGQRHDD